jgi:hypothetical protein
MPQYMLLLYGYPNYQQMSPEEMQKATEKYMAWRNLPITRDGQRLDVDSGRVIRPQAGKPRVSDGPYSETKEIFAGYYTIEAASYDEAVKHALSHPHLEYNGLVEVRHIFGT